MCVAHEHGGDKSGIRKTRKLAECFICNSVDSLEKVL